MFGSLGFFAMTREEQMDILTKKFYKNGEKFKDQILMTLSCSLATGLLMCSDKDGELGIETMNLFLENIDSDETNDIINECFQDWLTTVINKVANLNNIKPDEE